MLDLAAHHLTAVKSILSQWVAGKKVVAFGSRVKGNAKPFSDLDLAIYSQTPLSTATVAHLRDAFSASMLPFKVDFVEIRDVDESFRRIIEHDSELIQADSNETSNQRA